MISRIDKQIKKLTEARQSVRKLLRSTGHSVDDLMPAREATSAYRFALKAERLKDLKMACIMDRFTLDSYRPECKLLELTPEHWRQELQAFEPDLLFVESAWEGKDKLWHRKIANSSTEYYELTSYCKEKKIPIVFWNKEDPIYTDTFMAAAGMADFVFTTEVDCIQQYKTTLGHNRVYHLHFAAQPAVHNPIEKYERQDRFCFAGAYYHRYPERAKVFDRFAKECIAGRGLDIYDRNYQTARPEHAFPKQYNACIKGKLDPSEIDVAYKGYAYGINMNSVSQSQTMFARRVFELMASGTVVVSNYSRGMKNYFGDLTLCTDDITTLQSGLTRYCADQNTLRKYRLAGLRQVLSAHLYEDRLAFVIRKVFERDLLPALAPVAVIAPVSNQAEADKILSMYRQQTYHNKTLVLISSSPVKAEGDDIRVLREQEMTKWNGDGYVSLFHCADFYGPNYILDLILTTRYAAFDAIGKASYYIQEENHSTCQAGSVYAEHAEGLAPRRAIVSAAIVRKLGLESFLAQPIITDVPAFCVDEFNYCMNAERLPEEASDLVIEDKGIAQESMEEIARGIHPEAFDATALVLTPDMILAQCANGTRHAAVSIESDLSVCAIRSDLQSGQHHYFYLDDLIDVEEYREQHCFPIIFEGTGDLDIVCVCICLDRNKNKLEALFPKLNSFEKLSLPEKTQYVRLGFRPKGTGVCRLRRIVVGQSSSENVSGFLSRSNVLVLSNQYPSPEALYRNMFVHKRVMQYKEKGCLCDVMRMNIYATNQYREFDGINVTEGQGETLMRILETGKIDTVCVHFLDEEMWAVLEQYADRVRIVVWLHGIDIQPWWRRSFQYETDEALTEAKNRTEKKLRLWNDVFRKTEQFGFHFVFVSKLFAEEVFEDYKLRLPENRYSIIHNCIDVELFSYEEKSEQQRKKLLSIRPYASNVYANDLTVRCILELSKKEYFSELEFLLVGSGELFDKTVHPLRKCKNVKLEKRFLRQEEIAILYKEYGIFLTPTRSDTQGVSRDEAMASGLVPITNSVAAIPEFVDSDCGILAPAEDFQAMADGVDMLYHNPEVFLQMSNAASQRVRNQSSSAHTIDKEILLIQRKKRDTR